jgi:zinc protease
LLTASSRDPVGNLTVTVSTNPANIDKVTAAVMEELERFLKDGPTEKEVADAKQAFVESQKVGRTGDAAIAGQIVSNLNTGRTFAFTADQEKAILALTPVRVAEAFRKHIDPHKLVILRAGDFHKK